jgi:DNA-binding response OmpR family regulator
VAGRSRELRQPLLTFEGVFWSISTCLTTFRGRVINLTPTEYRLLVHFVGNPRRIYGKNELIEKLWNHSAVTNDEIIKTHMKGLRSKLSAVGAARNVIETVYGLGYRLKAHV